MLLAGEMQEQLARLLTAQRKALAALTETGRVVTAMVLTLYFRQIFLMSGISKQKSALSDFQQRCTLLMSAEKA